MKLYDKRGVPISAEAWARLRSDESYGLIARDTIAPGVTVSTAWVGMDQSVQPGGTPMTFETAVFRDGVVTDRRWHPTEEAALTGHHQLVATHVAKSARPSAS